MEYILNGRWPHWKMTLIEDDHNGWQTQCNAGQPCKKTTLMGRYSPKKPAHGKMTSIQNDMNGRKQKCMMALMEFKQNEIWPSLAVNQ